MGDYAKQVSIPAKKTMLRDTQRTQPKQEYFACTLDMNFQECTRLVKHEFA